MDNDRLMDIQWYPGHMTKTKRMLVTQMKLVDVVVELLDARVPMSSRNPDLDTLAKDKRRVLVLNKADLADPDTTAQWEEYFRQLGFFALAVNAKDNDKKKGGTGRMAAKLQEIMRPKSQQQLKRGRVNIPIRAMIVGIPNVGKSTFINQLAGRASTITADRPGVTRGRQWIKIDNSFDLMDTPGVLWPKFEDQMVGLRLAVTGAVSDNILDKITLCEHLIKMLMEIDPQILSKRYKTDLTPPMPPREILTEIGAARGFKMKGGIIDIERAAIIITDEFRGGKLGRISLEKPPEEKSSEASPPTPPPAF
ncbi:MAG: ribosome biogenesis GTPase YlqF [Defluviitaleaceae bacterium]|nr:ribosome biogenesis GTPase YlqF [Defluviitaleaceae bacterium]